MKKITLFLITSCAALLVHADPAATGRAIADALNKRDVEGVMRQMDVDAVTRLVLKDLGMSARDRESVAKGLPKALRTNLQAQDFPAAYRTLDTFPESFRKTRQWAVMRVTYAGRVDEATHRSALRHLAQHFGADPELQFMLIDHYVFESQFDRALAAVGALEKAIGGMDGATANIRGSILMGAKRYPEAEKACRQGMAAEPDHRNAYWCLVGVGLTTNSGKTAVEGLKAYEKAFETQFDLNKLGELENYRGIAKTPEFVAWKKSRR
jgi:hypothetical protein